MLKKVNEDPNKLITDNSESICDYLVSNNGLDSEVITFIMMHLTLVQQSWVQECAVRAIGCVAAVAGATVPILINLLVTYINNSYEKLKVIQLYEIQLVNDVMFRAFHQKILQYSTLLKELFINRVIMK